MMHILKKTKENCVRDAYNHTSKLCVAMNVDSIHNCHKIWQDQRNLFLMVIKCNNHCFWTGKIPITPRNMQETGFTESRSHAYIWCCMHGGTCGRDIRFNPLAWKLIQLLTLQTRFDLVLINKQMKKHALCFGLIWKR